MRVPQRGSAVTESSHAHSANGTPITLVNVFEVPAQHVDAFIARWRERAALMSTQPGFVDTRLHRVLSSHTWFQFVNVAHWDSAEAVQASQADPEFQQRVNAAIADPQCGSRHIRRCTGSSPRCSGPTWP